MGLPKGFEGLPEGSKGLQEEAVGLPQRSEGLLGGSMDEQIDRKIYKIYRIVFMRQSSNISHIETPYP